MVRKIADFGTELFKGFRKRTTHSYPDFSLSISPTLRSKTTRETICKSCRTALIGRKRSPVKGKEERGRKEQYFDNHVADMVAMMSSDHYFVRKSINLYL